MSTFKNQTITTDRSIIDIINNTPAGSHESNIKVVSKIDSSGRKDSYINRSRKHNHNRVKIAYNGASELTDLYMLQVRGINQLAKEIQEVKNLPEKFWHENGLHINEMTKEVEG
jgi:hypothetical protein